jgi:hypothetical protein
MGSLGGFLVTTNEEEMGSHESRRYILKSHPICIPIMKSAAETGCKQSRLFSRNFVEDGTNLEILRCFVTLCLSKPLSARDQFALSFSDLALHKDA